MLENRLEFHQTGMETGCRDGLDPALHVQPMGSQISERSQKSVW